MSTVLYKLRRGSNLFDGIDAIPSWPEGPWTIADFRPMYSATRQQIAHIVGYARTIASIRDLDNADRAQLIAWAEEVFLIDAYRKPIDWRPRAARAAYEICFAHVSVYLQGQNFRAEMVRIKATGLT